jgi:putative zinc finger/helix-turn-helix YgiT family protein
MTTARENFKYMASGLPGVTLVGVEITRCGQCGEFEVSIPHIEDLHRLLATTVAAKPARLAAEEIRFLRKWLGWSGVDFAAHMGVDPATVSRWENDSLPMGGQAERLLRLMVSTREPIQNYSLDALKQISDTKAPPLRLGFKADRDGWRVAA